MSYKHILVEKKEDIGKLIINRPPVNVLNIEAMDECSSALKEMNKDPGIKVVLVTGAGNKAFCAGVDVADHTPEKVNQMLASFYGIIKTLLELSKPSIAVVNGTALGGGCEVVLACDMVVATAKSTFGQPEINVGVYPGIANVLMPRLIPRKKAVELILSGETISAEEALRIGLINKIVSEEELEKEVHNFTKKFATKSGIVLSLTRKSIIAAFDKTVDEGFAISDKIYLDELMKTADANEGIKAFLEKRKPVWKNK